MRKKATKILSLFICSLLVFQQSGFGQLAETLDISAHLSALSNSIVQPDKFRPLHLRYLSYDSVANNFNLLLDKGDFKKGDGSVFSQSAGSKKTEPSPFFSKALLQAETKQLLNYFFIGISLPNESFWVNLRPDSPDNIVDPLVEQTDIGKVFLEADLQLKKDTASFTSPQTVEGKTYWDKLYKKAEELYGTDNVTIPTLTRPWIVPDEIIIRESTDNAYVYKATLKVMLESDYLESRPDLTSNSTTPQDRVLTDYAFKDARSKALNKYSTQLIKETIIPKLTREVNSSKRYASLRQVYYSLILAQWFKQKFSDKQGLSPKGTVPVYISLIDRKNLQGLTSKNSWGKDTYFQAYKQSFAQGEYNIKEPVYTPTGQVIRNYMSGGIRLNTIALATSTIEGKASSSAMSIFVGNKNILSTVDGGSAASPFDCKIKTALPFAESAMEGRVTIGSLASSGASAVSFTDNEIAAMGLLVNERANNKITPEEYYEKLSLIVDPKTKVRVDLGEEAGQKAIKIFEEELGEDFIPLLVEPGISTRTTEFVPFAKEKIKILREANQAVSARLIRDEFKEHLGFVDVYRAIFVTAEAAAEIANKGMKAPALLDSQKEMGKLLSRGTIEDVRGRLQMSNDSFHSSVSMSKDIAAWLAAEATNGEEKAPWISGAKKGSQAFLFSMHMPKIYLLEWNKDYFSYQGNDRETILISANDGAVYYKDDPREESFIELFIDPLWIRENPVPIDQKTEYPIFIDEAPKKLDRQTVESLLKKHGNRIPGWQVLSNVTKAFVEFYAFNIVGGTRNDPLLELSRLLGGLGEGKLDVGGTSENRLLLNTMPDTAASREKLRDFILKNLQGEPAVILAVILMFGLTHFNEWASSALENKKLQEAVGSPASVKEINAGSATKQEEADRPLGGTAGRLNSLIEGVINDEEFIADNRGKYNQAIEAGKKIFESYASYLSEKGKTIKSGFDSLDTARLEEKEYFQGFRELIKNMPRLSGNLNDLHLELFKDGLSGMSDEDVRIFCNLRGSLFFDLTKGCSNQCLLCNVSAALEKLSHMPFPMAANILLRVSKAFRATGLNLLHIVPYFDSEPLDYYDSVIGATVADFTRIAKRLGFTVTIITHGSNYWQNNALSTLKDLDLDYEPIISLHPYHYDLLNYAQAKVDNLSSADRERIINKYYNYFLGLLKARAKYTVNLYSIDMDTLDKYLNDSGYLDKIITPKLSREVKERLKKAFLIIKEMENVKEELYNKIESEGKVAIKENRHDQEFFWSGRAGLLLKKLEVPDVIIRAIQDGQSARRQLFDTLIDTDGTAKLILYENKNSKFRTIGEIFKDTRSEKFKFFVRFLKGIANNREEYLFEEKPENIGVVGQVAGIEKSISDEVWAGASQYLISKNINGGGELLKSFRIGIDERYKSYIKALLALNFPHGLFEKQDEEIFQAIKDVVFPVSVDFMLKSDSYSYLSNILTLYAFKYDFAGEVRISDIRVDSTFQLLSFPTLEQNISLGSLPASSVSTAGSPEASEDKVTSSPMKLTSEAAKIEAQLFNLRWILSNKEEFSDRPGEWIGLYLAAEKQIGDELIYLGNSELVKAAGNNERRLRELQKDFEPYARALLVRAKNTNSELMSEYALRENVAAGSLIHPNGIEPKSITERFGYAILNSRLLNSVYFKVNDFEIKIYDRLGVKWFIKRLPEYKTQFETWKQQYNERLKYSPLEKRRERLGYELQKYNNRIIRSKSQELGKLISFGGFIAPVVIASFFVASLTVTGVGLLFAVTVANVGINLYPLMAQRYNRYRAEKSIGWIERELSSINYRLVKEKSYDIFVAPSNSSGSPAAEKTSVTSPIGGIDMRNLPQHTKIEQIKASSTSKQGQSPSGTVPVLQDREWFEMQKLINAGITPSLSRFIDWLSSLKEDEINSGIDKALACIADILRSQEDSACCTESQLKQILVLLESDKSPDELKMALNNINIQEKEPVSVGQ